MEANQIQSNGKTNRKQPAKKPALVEVASTKGTPKAQKAGPKVVGVKTPPISSVRPPVRPAHVRRRHFGLMFSFLLMVLFPISAGGWYLWERAVDQYASDMGFTVRREETRSAVDVFGSLANFSVGGSSDSDILFNYIQSQELVRLIDDRLDLHKIYSKHYDQDPVFSLKPDGAIEDLRNYWQQMVQVSYAQGTGLIELKALAFEPEDARDIARAIFEESSQMINMLSVAAREDAISYARDELDVAVEQLKASRQALTSFRSRTQIIDPKADIQLQMGLLTTLQQQLGVELINYDLLLETTRKNDPRLTLTKQRIDAIRVRITDERRKFGEGNTTSDGQSYATLVSEFERLSVDREFAEQKYTGALSNFDLAQIESQHQTRYLAAFVQPTLAERAEYPQRILLFGLLCLFVLIFWAISALLYYSLRDRS